MPLDKQGCHRLYSALTCAGNSYEDDFQDPAVRKAHAEKFVAAHPECGAHGHTPYVSPETRCNLIGGRRQARKSRQARKTRKSRRTHRSRRNRN